METKNIEKYIALGAKDKDWYANTEKLFAEIFGRENVPLVAKMFAATSINSSLKSNIRLFRKAWYELKTDKPHENYLPNIRDQLNRLRHGQELSGKKINAFAAAMSGDRNSVVVDVWLLRAFGEERKYGRASGLVRSSGATDKQFSIIETWVRTEAAWLKLQPRELSAIIWSGVRIDTTGDYETSYHNILRHQMYNMFDVTI